MNSLLSRIRQVKRHNCEMFAHPLIISDNLLRWQDKNNPLHYNKNHFMATGTLTVEDIEKAIAFQKERNLQGFILKTEQPLERELVEQFALCEETLLLMTQQKNAVQWKINPNIEIRDCQETDISVDLLNACMELAESEYHRKWIHRAISEALRAAQSHPEYHWLAAYLDGKLVARCYALEWNGLVQMEDLWTHKDFRHQHIATTLLEYIRKTFRQDIFFHTEAEDSAKDFYRKLGFETIACCYEYRKEW